MRKLWTALFLLVPIFGVGLFVMSAVQRGGWLPDNISATGQEIDQLFYIILAITGLLFVVTEVLLAWAMWTGRGNERGKANYTHGNRTMEIGWTLGTSIVLLFVAFYQMPAWAKAKFYENRPRKSPDVLIEASQFLWQVRYPNWSTADNKPSPLDTLNPHYNDSFELINELHVYAGEAYLVHLRTRDVIHSFWLPAVRVKQDTLPGHLTPVWFQIDKDKLAADKKKTIQVAPGKNMDVYEYEWVCAELCGWGHYRMRAKLIVHPTKEQYLDWLRTRTDAWKQVAAPASGAAGGSQPGTP